ncbi:MAG: hypothetical protein ACPGYQ_05465, partial [Candidatus Puniceispirillales bacterium]
MNRYPDFRLEQEKLSKYPDAFVIGIDEAGRGPWAGPVVAGAAWISPDAVNDLPKGLTDSKKLSEARRLTIYETLLEQAKDQSRLRLASAAISAADIDEMGILPATFQAMQDASDQLYHSEDHAKPSDQVILMVDGSIRPELTS